jgi:monoamine oxidase
MDYSSLDSSKTAGGGGHEVIIVGAGISGCGAAWLLHKQGHSSLILEANSRSGGKMYTVPDGRGASGHVDLGASWVNDTTQTYIDALIEELGLKRLEQNIDGLAIAQNTDGSFFTHSYHDSVVRTWPIYPRHPALLPLDAET